MSDQTLGLLLLVGWLVGPFLLLLGLLWVGKRADRRKLEEIERAWRLPSRGRLGLSDLEVEQQLRPRRSLLVFSGRRSRR